MAMNTTSASALTRGARRLKDLATDAIVLPSLEELAARKADELRDARDRLNAIVKRQIAIESGQRRRTGDNTSILAEKAAMIERIEKLQTESGILKEQLRALNPPKLSPMEQWRREMFAVTLPEQKGRTPEQIRAARAEVDRLVERELQGRIHGRNVFNPDPKEAAELKKARARLMALEGEWCDAQRGVVSLEDYKQAKKELGL
jgi:hypothetical protein